MWDDREVFFLFFYFFFWKDTYLKDIPWFAIFSISGIPIFGKFQISNPKIGKEPMAMIPAFKIRIYFVLLIKSHLQSYPCPLSLESFI